MEKSILNSIPKSHKTWNTLNSATFIFFCSLICFFNDTLKVFPLSIIFFKTLRREGYRYSSGGKQNKSQNAAISLAPNSVV